jgi:hypothetical protein
MMLNRIFSQETLTPLQLKTTQPTRAQAAHSSSLAPGLIAVSLFLLGAMTAQAASVTGTVRYDGPEVRLRAIRMNADPNCEKIHAGEKVLQDDKVIGGEGELANVFVYLAAAPDGTGPFTAPTEPATLTQHGCMYQPKVQGLLVQQNLDVVNDDETLHNVRCLARDNRPFNLGQPAKGKRTKFFTKPEKAIKFKCDVHPWMASYVFVMDHPFFAVSDEQGKFEIRNLPPGRYSVVAWHEIFGEKEMEVDVGADGGTVDFTFSE